MPLHYFQHTSALLHSTNTLRGGLALCDLITCCDQSLGSDSKATLNKNEGVRGVYECMCNVIVWCDVWKEG